MSHLKRQMGLVGMTPYFGKYKHGNKSALFSSMASSRLMNTGNKISVEAKGDICNKSTKSKFLDLV